MSKRFGRNQRRKLQQQVENFRAAHEREMALTKRIRNERDVAVNGMRELRRLLGEDSRYLPPQRHPYPLPVDGRVRRCRMPSIEDMIPDSDPISQNVIVETEELVSLVAEVVHNVPAFRHDIHMLMRGPSNMNLDIAYSISVEALRRHGADQAWFREMGLMIGRELMSYFAVKMSEKNLVQQKPKGW